MKFKGNEPLLADTLEVLLPCPEQTLFLRACLAVDAGESWRLWIATTPNLRAALAEGRPEFKRLLPLLHYSRDRNGFPLDEATQSVLRLANVWEERRAARIRAILVEVLGALAEASVTPILLKGVALAETAYPSPSCRHCHDIDLWVSPSDLEPTGGALKRLGFRRARREGKSPAALRFVHADGLPISLHVELHSLAYCRPPDAEMRARARLATIAGVPTTILSPMDTLLQLCGQWAAGAARDRTSWVADAIFLVRSNPPTEADWALLAATAAASGLSLPLFVMLGYLRSEFAAAIPDLVLARIGSDAAQSPAMHRDAVLAIARKGLPGRFAAMVRRSSWRSRVEIARWLIFPSRPFLQAWCVEKGLRWSPAWYFGRPFRRLAIRAGMLQRPNRIAA